MCLSLAIRLYWNCTGEENFHYCAYEKQARVNISGKKITTTVLQIIIRNMLLILEQCLPAFARYSRVFGFLREHKFFPEPFKRQDQGVQKIPLELFILDCVWVELQGVCVPMPGMKLIAPPYTWSGLPPYRESPLPPNPNMVVPRSFSLKKKRANKTYFTHECLSQTSWFHDSLLSTSHLSGGVC